MDSQQTLSLLEKAHNLNPYNVEALNKLRAEKHRQGVLGLGPCAVAVYNKGAWDLADNDVWNLPTDTNEVRFDATYDDRGFHRPILTLRGLAVDCEGCVYGWRTLSDRREEGYEMGGRVSIGGKKHRAHTSSRMFRRPDGTLVEVAIFYVHRV